MTVILTVSCRGKSQKTTLSVVDSVKRVQTTALQKEINTENEIKPETTEIICDSVYKDKEYKIILRRFSDDKSYDEKDRNTVFTFNEKVNGKYTELFRDSIESHFESFEFKDFNGDKIKDILIENISDVRSNLTYYLYLVDLNKNKLKKIKGFEKIKNPHFLSKYNLIDNYVNSGTNWTSFYEIKSDSIRDFKIVVYDNLTENSTYEKDYMNAIRKILIDKK